MPPSPPQAHHVLTPIATADLLNRLLTACELQTSHLTSLTAAHTSLQSQHAHLSTAYTDLGAFYTNELNRQQARYCEELAALESQACHMVAQRDEVIAQMQHAASLLAADFARNTATQGALVEEIRRFQAQRAQVSGTAMVGNEHGTIELELEGARRTAVESQAQIRRLKRENAERVAMYAAKQTELVAQIQKQDFGGGGSLSGSMLQMPGPPAAYKPPVMARLPVGPSRKATGTVISPQETSVRFSRIGSGYNVIPTAALRFKNKEDQYIMDRNPRTSSSIHALPFRHSHSYLPSSNSSPIKSPSSLLHHHHHALLSPSPFPSRKRTSSHRGSISSFHGASNTETSSKRSRTDSATPVPLSVAASESPRCCPPGWTPWGKSVELAFSESEGGSGSGNEEVGRREEEYEEFEEERELEEKREVEEEG